QRERVRSRDADRPAHTAKLRDAAGTYVRPRRSVREEAVYAVFGPDLRRRRTATHANAIPVNTPTNNQYIGTLPWVPGPIASARPHAAERWDVQQRDSNGRRRPPTPPHVKSDFRNRQNDGAVFG